MSSKKHSNAASQLSRGNASKGQMQLTSYLWKKIGMLWKNYGKAMEFLFWGSVRTLPIHLTSYLICMRMLILYYIDSTIAALTKDESEFKMYIMQSISN